MRRPATTWCRSGSCSTWTTPTRRRRATTCCSSSRPTRWCATSSGAKAIPAGGYWAMPKLSMPGAVLVGDGAGMVNLAALKGVHYAIKAGMIAAESIYQQLKKDSNDFTNYEEAIDESIIGRDLYEQRNTRQPFSMGLI